MTVKKSNYNMLKYICQNEAMKARADNDMWFCYVPEIDDMACFYDNIESYYEINIGLRFIPDMLDRKKKFKWEVMPITEKEHYLISENIRIRNSMENLKRERSKAYDGSRVL